jgi:hypothetical protein
VWQKEPGGWCMRTGNIVGSAGVETGLGRHTPSSQGETGLSWGVISCRSGEGCVPERVPCGDQNKFPDVSSSWFCFGEREEEVSRVLGAW